MDRKDICAAWWIDRTGAAWWITLATLAAPTAPAVAALIWLY